MKKLILILVFIFSLSVYSQETWNVIHYNEYNVPSGNITYINENEAWAIGSGDIAYTNDGGVSWTTQYSKPDYNFVSVFFIDNQTGWVVGWSEVLKTTDGGQNWNLQELPNPMGLDVESVFFLNQDTGWIAGSYKSIYYTENGGENWDVQHPYQLGQHYFLYDIRFFDNLNGCAVGGKLLSPELGIIMTTNNGGEDWAEQYPAGSEEFIKVQYINSEIIWACDRAGKLFKSVDGGDSWDIFEDSFGYLNDMYFFDNNNSLTISSSYKVNITNNSWQSWNVILVGYPGALHKFSFTDDQLGLGVGNESLLKTTDAGEHWKRINDKFTGIGFFNEDIGYAIQEWPNNIPMKTNDGGYTWEEMNLNLNGYITNLDFISETTGFMINSGNELLKTFDAGNNWQITNLPIDTGMYNDIQFIDENIGFLCTDNSIFVKTADGGATVNTFNFDTVNSIRALYFNDENNGWIVGSEGFCGITANGGESWDAVIVGDQTLVDVWFTNDQNGFILANLGDVYRTDDGGYTWDLLSLEANSPLEVNFLDEDNGWIVCRNRVYFTEDNGVSWNEELSIDWTIDRFRDFARINNGNSWICTQNGRIYNRTFSSNINVQQTNTNGITCYPNPANEKLNVVIDQPASNKYIVDIYSIGGISFGSQKVELSDNNTFEIMLEGLPAGIYFLKIFDSQEIKILKFIKG